ncbi:MAG: hypothetical protein HDS75_01400 [Bacteroidales bacterium]|nr:hypothetical protein [Bacteroidales bacterium]
MRKIASFIAIILSFGLTLSSAETPKSILDKTLSALNAATGYEARFAIVGDEGGSKGEITISGDKFIIKSEGIQIWYDGRTQWSYTEHTGEVNITEPTEEELAEVNPLVILNSDPDVYRLKLRKKDNDSYTIQLTDKTGDLAIAKALITIKSADWLPYSANIETASGDKFAVVLNNIKKLKNISPDVFKFNPKNFPGVEVIDLR